MLYRLILIMTIKDIITTLPHLWTINKNYGHQVHQANSSYIEVFLYFLVDKDQQRL